MNRVCSFCGGEIPLVRLKHRAKYCTTKCRIQNQLQRYHERNPKVILSAHLTNGIISEYRTIVDLLSKGYDVFNHVSPSCSCDLAILKNNQLLRVEVRTGHYSATGAIYKNKQDVRADILAIALHDKIVYDPPLPL